MLLDVQSPQQRLTPPEASTVPRGGGGGRRFPQRLGAAGVGCEPVSPCSRDPSQRPSSTAAHLC